MTLSLYSASAPVFIRLLTNLDAILGKGAAFATGTSVDPAQLIEARLAPDMRPLVAQVQMASDTAKGAVARLAGIDVPAIADTETSFADLSARIAKTIAFIETVPASAIEGHEDREILFKAGPNTFTFTGRSYLLTFALPNFMFHVTTAYGILRHEGVALGKPDFLGAMQAA
jgi:hypothetical protein